MKKNIIDIEILSSWIFKFIEENNKSPGIRDLYKYKGCPYDKSSILREYGNLSNLYKKLNIDRKVVGYDNISDDELLAKLKYFVIKYRTTDRDILKKKGLYDRSVYERRFKTWSNALKLSGIDNSTKVLIKYFENYNGEDYIKFLKDNIGEYGDFTSEQYDIINKASKVAFDKDLIRKTINYSYIKRNFKTVSILLIACGKEPTVTYCSGNKYIAKDRHECDSSKEVIIDNFLYENNIDHEIHTNYPNSNFKCDFKVNDIFIEYAGLMDKKKYSNDIRKKIEFCKNNNIKQIILYNTKKETLSNLKVALESDLH